MSAVAIGQVGVVGGDFGAKEGGELAEGVVMTEHEIYSVNQVAELFELFGVGSESGA